MRGFEYMDFKDKLSDALADCLNLPKNEIYARMETPPEPEMGDFALPCFTFAKTMRKAPQMIAKELAETFAVPDFIERAEALGPYLNFFLKKEVFAEAVIKEAAKKGEMYGGSDIGRGKTVVIDYSSPNIAKPFHIGHLRSTVIGNALYNIYSLLGWKCVGINHLGDWGTQFGKLITAYKKWGGREAVEENGIEELTALYVRFHEEAEKDDSLNDEARAWFVKMQENDGEALELWKWFYDISMREFERVYDMLGIKFDANTGESFYNDKMPPVIEEIKEKGLLTESRGAMIVDLEEHGLPPCLIVRKDGGTLYATRDITAVLYRKKTYNFDKALYLTALDQNLHFTQVFRVLEKMGYDFDLNHVPFGLVSLDTGKLSTRRGNVVLMEELLNEAVCKTAEIIEERSPGLENRDEIARCVGIGAVIFNDLYNGRIKDVVFSWEKMLNFNGETGPYAQYTYTRANSVLKKAEAAGLPVTEDVDFSALADENSFAVLKCLYAFPDKLADAAEKNEPSVISRHLIQLCQAFNKFYNETPVIRAEEKERAARLLLVRCVRDTLKTMLSLLGLGAPEKM